MKKIVSMLLCLSLLALAGCARSEQAKNNSNPLPTETWSGNSSGNPHQDKPSDDGPHGSGGAWAIDEIAPHELEPSGRMRGNLARSMRIDIGTVELAAHTTSRFDLTSSEENATLRFLLISADAGEAVEGSVTGSGGVTLNITAAGRYVLTLENLSELDVYFTIDYAFGGTSL